MELLEGQSLASRLTPGPLPLSDAGPIVLSMLSALEALHQRQIVHRDLKPSNVFLTPHGVKLLDFGLARTFHDSDHVPDGDLTRTGFIVGTPRYMAPEQWKGEPADARTDLFAVGAILFEVLTGTPPFPGNSAAEARHATLFDQPPALSGRVPLTTARAGDGRGRPRRAGAPGRQRGRARAHGDAPHRASLPLAPA